jgi:hypothetical protein
MPSHSTDFNNLREFSLGTPIANQDVKSQRLLLGGSGSREGYDADSRIRSQVGSVVSRAPVRQGIQLRRLHSVRLVASAWLRG